MKQKKLIEQTKKYKERNIYTVNDDQEVEVYLGEQRNSVVLARLDFAGFDLVLTDNKFVILPEFESASDTTALFVLCLQTRKTATAVVCNPINNTNPKSRLLLYGIN